MEFLVHIRIRIPDGIADDARDEFMVAEAVRARELADEGHLVRLWRVPGQTANWGLWEAPDATSLHDALMSLPLHPYMEVEVFPMAIHPNDPGAP